MSALRLGRLPDGTRDIRILEPAVGRITHTRGALFVGSPIVTETERDRQRRAERESKARRREVRG